MPDPTRSLLYHRVVLAAAAESARSSIDDELTRDLLKVTN
jgi:hypothetical protein